MAISRINPSFSGAQALNHTNNGKQPTSDTSQALSPSEDAAFQELIDYFFESPAQRIIDNWLRAHHITKEQFNAMPPEQQEAIRRQIAREIKDRCEEKTKERLKADLCAIT